MINLKGFGFSYGSQKIFEGLDLSFAENEIHCILGPSGIGKTTLLSILASGSALNGAAKTFAAGGAVSGVRENFTDEISYVYQEARLINEKTAVQNVELVLHGIYPDKRRRRAEAQKYLALVGLEGAENKYPGFLSGGMARRAALARAFAYPSKLLLMDEPFKDLDLKNRRTALNTFLELYEKEPRTVVFVTHDINEAVLCADKIFVFNKQPIDKANGLDIGKPRKERSLADKQIAAAVNKIYELILKS